MPTSPVDDPAPLGAWLRAVDWARAPQLARTPPRLSGAVIAGHPVCLLRVPVAAEDDLPALLPLLAPHEAERARAMSPARQAEFVTLRAALRLALAPLTGEVPARVPIALDDAGKPHLARATPAPPAAAAPGPWFSLSHAAGAGLIALCASAPVGVDLESAARRTRIDPRAVAARVFGPGDRAALAACPEPARATAFLRLWVRREAAVKALGVGLARSFGELDVGEAHARPIRVPPLAPGAATRVLALADLPDPGPEHLAAAALALDPSAILAAPP